MFSSMKTVPPPPPALPNGGEEPKMLVKLVFEDCVRLTQVATPPTMKEIRGLFKEMHGDRAKGGALSYSLPEDDDRISLVTDADLRLAASLRPWAQSPLKIVSEAGPDTGPVHEEGKDTWRQAEENLSGYGVKAPASQLKLLCQALGVGPRRMVRVGLAHPMSIKLLPKEDQVMEDTGEDEANTNKSSWEEVEALKITDNAAQDEEVVIVGSDADKEDLPQAVAMGPAPAPGAPAGAEDACVAALRAKGVTLPAEIIHALLRLLAVHPRKFIKAGLLSDIKVAREAFKTGGAAAAHILFKAEKKRAMKGWGRGLSGRGRGRFCTAGSAACKGGRAARAGFKGGACRGSAGKGGRGGGWAQAPPAHRPWFHQHAQAPRNIPWHPGHPHPGHAHRDKHMAAADY
jgi:hypothetical protein